MSWFFENVSIPATRRRWWFCSRWMDIVQSLCAEVEAILCAFHTNTGKQSLGRRVGRQLAASDWLVDHTTKVKSSLWSTGVLYIRRSGWSWAETRDRGLNSRSDQIHTASCIWSHWLTDWVDGWPKQFRVIHACIIMQMQKLFVIKFFSSPTWYEVLVEVYPLSFTVLISCINKIRIDPPRSIIHLLGVFF